MCIYICMFINTIIYLVVYRYYRTRQNRPAVLSWSWGSKQAGCIILRRIQTKIQVQTGSQCNFVCVFRSLCQLGQAGVLFLRYWLWSGTCYRDRWYISHHFFKIRNWSGQGPDSEEKKKYWVGQRHVTGTVDVCRMIFPNIEPRSSLKFVCIKILRIRDLVSREKQQSFGFCWTHSLCFGLFGPGIGLFWAWPCCQKSPRILMDTVLSFLIFARTSHGPKILHGTLVILVCGDLAGNVSKSLKINEKILKTHRNHWKSLKFMKNQWKSLKCVRNHWKTLNFNQNHGKIMKIHAKPLQSRFRV